MDLSFMGNLIPTILNNVISHLPELFAKFRRDYREQTRQDASVYLDALQRVYIDLCELERKKTFSPLSHSMLPFCVPESYERLYDSLHVLERAEVTLQDAELREASWCLRDTVETLAKTSLYDDYYEVYRSRFYDLRAELNTRISEKYRKPF